MNNVTSSYFSIVISVYNRAAIIKRCILSCLSQSYEDYELIIVNDGSTDCTQEVVNSIQDSRIKLISHSKNLGNSPARNTGILNAKGKWIITLDSDHALLPHALETLYRMTQNASEDIGVVGSRYRWDTGRITPSFVPEGIIDYIGRIRWVEEEGGTDYLCCARRDVYKTVSWPKDHRGSQDALFQLDLAEKWKEIIFEDILAIEYSDAENSITRTKGTLGVNSLLINAEDTAWQYQEILRKHGNALFIHGPRQYKRCFRGLGKNRLLAGHRLSGMIWMIKYLRMNWSDYNAWIILGLGIISPLFLARANANKKN